MYLDALVLGDDPDSWADAGFTLASDTCVIGSCAVVCRGDGEPPAFRLASDDVDLTSLDGIATQVVDPGDRVEGQDVHHANHVVEVDHVVVQSPDLDRTTDALATVGVDCRRIRDVPGGQMQQRFFRFGPVIIELVGSPQRSGDGTASIWGLALTVDDLDAAATHLGPLCGAPKDAVQRRRRIATMRTRDLGISIPIALMSPDPRRR